MQFTTHLTTTLPTIRPKKRYTHRLAITGLALFFGLVSSLAFAQGNADNSQTQTPPTQAQTLPQAPLTQPGVQPTVLTPNSQGQTLNTQTNPQPQLAVPANEQVNEQINGQTNAQPTASTNTPVSTENNNTALNPNLVNINTASAAEIQDKLVGIGAKKAQAIVDYREKNGRFLNLEQLTEVSGIGKATLEKNRDRIVLE